MNKLQKLAIANFKKRYKSTSFLSWEPGWNWIESLTSEHYIQSWVRIDYDKEEVWCTDGEGSSHTYPFNPNERFIEAFV